MKVSGSKGLLVKAMNRAMSAYGRSTKQRASIRQVAPDTGGRPYHFGFTTVTRGESTRGRRGAAAAAAGGAAPGTGGGTGGQGSRSDQSASARSASGNRRGTARANTREGAHQRYTERDGAVQQDAPAINPNIPLEREIGRDRDMDGNRERSNGIDEEVDPGSPGRLSRNALVGIDDSDPEIGAMPPRGRKRRPSEIAEDQEHTRDWVEEQLSNGQGVSPRAREAAAQAYIEDPTKTPSLMGATASFGTIGATLEERMEFWDLVHAHESAKGGRTQTRVVLELPHEATPEARHEIVRRYTDEFRRKGIPFWASIHAPTKDNDTRNHHAHVVFSDRPMAKMRHPETGERVWDFTVQEVYKTSSRNRITRYPYRQNRDPEMRDRAYVKLSRSRFATIVNAVMEESGNKVRYDPRSYKDMGLDVKPMRNVTRILADKINTRSFVVMDADWTRKMIDAEIQAAAARRDATFVKLQEAEHRLQEAARHSKEIEKANQRLPRHLRLPPGRILSEKLASSLMTKIQENQRDRLATKFADEATLSALEHVAKATAPHRPAKGKGRVHDPSTAPDADDLGILHAAALAEIAAFRSGAKSRSARTKIREDDYARQWRGDPPPAAPVPRSPGPTQGPSSPGTSEPMPGAFRPQPRQRSPEPPAVIYMGGPAAAPDPIFRASTIGRPGMMVGGMATGIGFSVADDEVASVDVSVARKPGIGATWPPAPGSFADRVFQQTSRLIQPFIEALRQDPTGAAEAMRNMPSFRDAAPDRTGPAVTRSQPTPTPTPTRSQPTPALAPRTPIAEQAVAGTARRDRLTSNPSQPPVTPAITPSSPGVNATVRAAAEAISRGAEARRTATVEPTAPEPGSKRGPQAPPPLIYTAPLPARERPAADRPKPQPTQQQSTSPGPSRASEHTRPTLTTASTMGINEADRGKSKEIEPQPASPVASAPPAPTVSQTHPAGLGTPSRTKIRQGIVRGPQPDLQSVGAERPLPPSFSELAATPDSPSKKQPREPVNAGQTDPKQSEAERKVKLAKKRRKAILAAKKGRGIDF